MTAVAKAARTGKGMLASTIVACVANVALAVAGFVGVEVVEARLSAAGQRAVVAVTRVKAVVDMAVKATMAVEPGAGTDEYAAINQSGP